jgi:NADH-quinone oxidoreductase subunit E
MSGIRTGDTTPGPDLNSFLAERRGEWKRDPQTARPVKRFSHGSRVPGWDEAVDLTKPPATIPDPASTEVPAELKEQIEAAMAKYPDRRSAVIPALHLAQEEHGWCSPEAIAQVASVMALTPAYLTSVATFYDMFKMVPSPRNDVYVCTNISCSLRGADDLFEAMLAAAQDSAEVDVRSFECLGACDIAPMASVNGEYVGPLTTEDAGQIIEDLIAGRPVLENKQLRFRRCADPGVGEAAGEFGPPPPGASRADAVGLPADGEPDRPGGSAAIERPVDEPEGASEGEQ